MEILKCGECGISLSVGASHRDLRACVDALRAELARVICCDSCGEEVGEYCFKCFAKRAALSKAGEWGTQWFMNTMSGLQGKKDKKKE